MKQFKIYVVILLLGVLIIPTTALAAWWNPFSWNIWNIFKPQTQTQQPTTNQQQNTQDQNKLNDQNKTQPSSNNPVSNVLPTSMSADKNSLFGTMIAFNLNDATMGMSGVIQKGWTEFRKDNSAYQSLLSNLKKLIQDRAKFVKATGFFIDRAGFNYFTWNVIEPAKGQFNWGLTDIYAKGALDSSIKISAVIQPFASWDQKNTQVNANCKMFDAAYYDYKAGLSNDLAEYEGFLTKTVERYKDTVAVWEIGNEPDAECNGYQNNPQGYFDLVKISSETIKKADPSAKIVNGGASGHSDNNSEISFWNKFFQLGGGQYIDYFNLHYNDERSPSAKLDTATFQKDLTFFNNLMDQNGGRKPLYLTEFGIYSGSSSSQPQTNLQAQPSQSGQPNNNQQPTQPFQEINTAPVNQQSGGRCGDGVCDDFEKQSGKCPQDCGTSSQQTTQQPVQQPQAGAITLNQNSLTESQNSQAALYFEDSILAFANGAKTVFIDLIGPDNNMVGSSMAFNTDGQPRLFLTTLKTINQKLSGFSKIEKIADGQYKFTVGSKIIYALWSGTLPSEISGQVKVADINGQEQTMNSATIKLSSNHPVLIEL